jgi:hypothetical protein
LVGTNINQNLLAFNQKIENRFQGIFNQMAQQSKRRSIVFPESGNVSRISRIQIDKPHIQPDEVEIDLENARIPMLKTQTTYNATQKTINKLDLID